MKKINPAFFVLTTLPLLVIPILSASEEIPNFFKGFVLGIMAIISGSSMILIVLQLKGTDLKQTRFSIFKSKWLYFKK